MASRGAALRWVVTGVLVVAGLLTWYFARSPAQDTSPVAVLDGDVTGPSSDGSVEPTLLPDPRSSDPRSRLPDTKDAPPEATAETPASGGPIDPETLTQLSVTARAYLAADQGRWKEAVKWLEEALATLPPGAWRDRAATLRVHLLMEEAPAVEGALALASLLGDAAVAMPKARGPGQTDAGRPEDGTIFSGAFTVAAHAKGTVPNNQPFERLMRGHNINLHNRSSHFRTEDAYLAHLASYVRAAVESLPEGSSDRRVLEATHAFIELNDRIRREGGERVRTRTTADLESAVVSFILQYKDVGDARVMAFGGFLFSSYRNWAKKALVKTEGD